jgi:tricorn protease
MRLPIRFALLAVPCLLQGQATLPELPRFVRMPDIHGDQVVFTYEGDLWKGNVQGGPALRLTTHPGTESNAHFSPDGKWIAFTGEYDAGSNVYVMPASGGSPRRLTWRGSCTVVGWSPDGAKVLFRAATDFDCRPINRVYAVDLQGHEPQALPLGKAVQAAYAPDGSKLLFTPKGDGEYNWKRYRGGDHPELWLADLKSGSYRLVTDVVGKSAYPMFSAQGGALFLSDRGEGGISNLYTLDLASGAAKPLTTYQDFDVHWPATDGHRVVFVQAGYLSMLDLATGAARRLEITAPSDGWRHGPRSVSAKEALQQVRLAGGGKSVVVEARGDVWMLPVDAAKPALNLTRTPGTRERFPEVSPDGKRVAYLADESGEYDLYVRPAEGGAAKRFPTGLRTALYHLVWSPDGSKLLFGDKSFALFVMDLATGKLTKIDEAHELKNDEFTWEVSDYAWAPDSTWVTYSYPDASRNNRIFLYNLKTRQKVALTTGFFDTLNPRFDLDGTTLYYLSYSNFEVRLDPSEGNSIEHAPVQVMAVKLRKDEAGKGEPFRIDLDGLAERTSALPVKAGNHFHLQAGKGVVGWSTVEGWDDAVVEEVFRPRGQAKWVMHFYDAGAKKETIVPDPVSEWGFDPEGGSLYVRKGDALHVAALQDVLAAKPLSEKLDLDRLTLTVVPREEWKQIFQDTWRWYRDFFYDTNMHGHDWQKVHDRYAAWLPQLTSRADLNWLLSQMVGELCVSHTYVSGGDFGPSALQGPAPAPGLLGADLAAEGGFYRFNRIYGPTPYAPALKAPLTGKVQQGEYLLAVDGAPLKAPEAVHEHLQVTKGQKVNLTVNTRPSFEGARVVEVEPLQRDNELRYQAWIAGNIMAVEKLSGGQLGYLHLTAMMGPNIGEFDKYWRAFRYRKGIVVDVRGNGGGWTEYFMIHKLEDHQVGFNVLRGMGPFRYPNTASDRRYVFLGNEQTGSDGEAFLAHVKADHLGPMVGTFTWGGLVGIVNTQFTLDGGRVEQSNNAFYGKEAQWWIENRGAQPDVPVVNDPASLLAGHDRQLEVGVETLLRNLKEQPTPAFPPVPAYPVR